MKRFLLLSLSLFLCMSFSNAQDKITDAEQQELLKVVLLIVFKNQYLKVQTHYFQISNGTLSTRKP